MTRLAVLAALAALAWLVAAALALAVPAVDMRAYIVLDPATGETLAARDADRALPQASTTKLMTALVALDRADPDDLITVPRAAPAIEGSSGELVAGETLSVRDLLVALLVPSGNDAAIALAEGTAGSQRAFVDLMNARARRMGLTRTHYANPHGLDAPGHHSSVRDLARLGRAAMAVPEIRAIVGRRRASIPGPGGRGVRAYESENLLLDIEPDADGVKTGMTDGAGYSLVAHARRRPLGVELYVAAIGSPSSGARARDAERLLEWGFSRYASATLLPDGAVLGRAPVAGRPGVSVPYRVASALRAPIRLGVPVTEMLVAPVQVSPPVAAGQVLGTVTLRQGAHVLGRRDLVAARGASEPGLWDRLRSGVEALVP